MGRKKSRMVREGNAAKKAKAAERKVEQELLQKQELQRKAEGRLKLSEFIPSGVRGLGHREDPELPTIEEIKAGTFKTAASIPDNSLLWTYLDNPTLLGRKNLLYFFALHENELKKVSGEIHQLEQRVESRGGQMPTRLVPKLGEMRERKLRLQKMLDYLKELIRMAKDDKIPLPDCRPRDNLKPGDVVICYIPEDDNFFAKAVQNQFMIGTVVDDERLCWKYGVPMVEFDTPVSSRPRNGGYRRVRFFQRMWFIMRPEEYEQLMSQADYREQWLWCLRGSMNNLWCHWVEQMYLNIGDGQGVIDRWRWEKKEAAGQNG